MAADLRVLARAVGLIVAALLAAGCSEEADEPPTLEFPTVVDATAAPAGDGTWTFDVTISSPYDSPAQYADAWRIIDADGTVYGVRELLHDHAGEQPFTRSLRGVEIPDAVTIVEIQGRDSENGWSPQRLEFTLP